VEAGEYRLLLVDGHNSHYTVAFLLYAREHLIIVLCYIPHSTHIFQGLDVVIFSLLKKMIGEERDKWLRENGVAMDKNNFLEVYSKAHVRALTPANIKAAFKKTGIWPYNPDVVTEDMLAPSKATSCEAHLPSPPDDPAVNVLATMFRQLAKISEAEDGPEVISEDPMEGPSNPTRFDAINEAVKGLSQTKLAHLISTTLTTSDDMMPTTTTQTICLPQLSPLLSIQPQTETEILLLAALRESHHANENLANRNIALQSHNLLNEAYCGNAKGALQFQEKKKQKKGQGTLPEGLACLVTGDTFYESRVNMEKDQRIDARTKETWKEAKAAWQVAVSEWQKKEDERKELKISETAKHKDAMEAWKAENSQGHGRGRGRGRGGHVTKTPQPVMATIPKQMPRPLLKNFIAGGTDEQLPVGSSSDGGSGNDEGSGNNEEEGTGSDDDNE
jgi:hypothetical protein